MHETLRYSTGKSGGPTAGIITLHKSLSYGACLQAWATKELLEEYGYTVSFIDYENSYEARKKSNAIYRYGTPKEIASSLAKRLLFHESEYHERAFGSFRQSLPLTAHSYGSADEMVDLGFDLLAVASDQVWNPQITGSLDPAFFLQFGQAARRVSIASSLGSYELDRDELERVSDYLSCFSAISVREQFACDQLSPYADVTIHVSLDPTLQLPAEYWRSLAAQPNLPFDKYTLVFMVSSSPSRYEKLAKRAREQLDAPLLLVRLNSKRPSFVDYVTPASPFELVWLIDNATTVLTDSFHGLAFCANLNTPFVGLPNTGNNVRSEELLHGLGLVTSMSTANGDDIDVTVPTNFDTANVALANMRAEDSRWLREAVGWGRNG